MNTTRTSSLTRGFDSIDLSGLRALLRTDVSPTALLLRLALAVVIFPHGAQKLLGWFGGPGFDGTISYLTQMVGLPAIIALLVVVIEFFGSIALAFGFLGRVASAGIAAVMVGAVLTSHLQFGFFMNWAGAQAGEGFEYHLLALAIALAVMIKGSGALSVDRALAS
jgi:putative oxidoreductase